MKKITFIRHAKSSWDFPHLSDHDRPLNDRGERDLPLMARYCAQHLKAPQHLYSSTALRAKLTAEVFAEAWLMEDEAIGLHRELFHCSASALLQFIKRIPDHLHHIGLAGHNPGLTDGINMLCKQGYLDNLPTTGVFELDLDIKSWKNVKKDCGQKLSYVYPKQLKA